MGGGTFTRTPLKIPVYVIGWYVEFEAAAVAPPLQRFKGTKAQELAQNPAFFDAIVEPAEYDRSVLLKLAMTVRA
jgi:hypothetical protein